MKKLYNKVMNVFFKKDFFIFLIIGVINTFNGTLLSIIYSQIFQANIAFIFGYITSTFISFILNSIFTFKAKVQMKRFYKFFISCMPNFAVQLLSVFIIYNWLGFNKIIAYLIAAVVGIPVTFIILKFYAFKNRIL